MKVYVNVNARWCCNLFVMAKAKANWRNIYVEIVNYMRNNNLWSIVYRYYLIRLSLINPHPWHSKMQDEVSPSSALFDKLKRSPCLPNIISAICIAVSVWQVSFSFPTLICDVPFASAIKIIICNNWCINLKVEVPLSLLFVYLVLCMFVNTCPC